MENKIKKLIEQANTVALFGHKNPDGDSIGGLLGFGKLLEKMGKKVSYFTPTLPSKIYDFLPDVKKISAKFPYKPYDLIVFLDFSETDRICTFYEQNTEYFNKSTIVVIDHHVCKCARPNRNVISDATAMSCCELIFEYSYKWRPELYDSQIATYLYVGLATDSGNFRYDEDHKRILRNALNLVNLGADKKLIINNLFRKKSFSGVKMMELMFRRMKKKGGLVYTRYTDKDLRKLNIDREEADFGQIIIQDIDDAEVSAIFRNDQNTKGCCISLRSKHRNVQEIAESFGGGGHIHAAGCTIPKQGTFKEQVETLSSRIAEFIKKHK